MILLLEEKLKSSIDTKIMKKITGVLDILVCLLLLISSLYKGGFYKEDSLFISMVICMLGLVCLSVKLVVNIRDGKVVTKSKLGTTLDILVMLMPIVYFLPVVFKTYASLESSIFECIRYINFAIIYFIVRTTQNKKTYLTSIVIMGVLLALLGIDEITFRALEKSLNTISIGYLDSANGYISSTLQYANVTALVMLIASIICESKLTYNLQKLKDTKNIMFKLTVGLEIFILILLQTAIILTTSRMNIFLMIVSTIVYGIYLYKTKNKKETLALILLLLASFVLVASIDSLLNIKEYALVIITYISTLIISLVLTVLSKGVTKSHIKEVTLFKKLNKKITLIIFIAILLIIVSVILFTKTSLKIKCDKDPVSITRNVYVPLDKKKLPVKVDITAKEDAKYTIYFYEYDKDYVKNTVLKVNSKDIKNGVYEGKFDVKENITNLEFRIKVKSGEVSVNKLNVDGKDISLSYMFIPDNIIFRLIDTFHNDSNNSLRYVYYKDAVKLFKLSPIIGHGGEGFKSRYQEVQDISYISSEVHNVPLQILVESGFLGCVTYLGIIIVTFIIIRKLKKYNKESSVLYLLLFGVFIIVSLFDLVLSYGIMIDIFAVIIGIIVGDYKKTNIDDNDSYKLDNKSLLGMIKIATLSVSLMALFMATLYSVNIYRASMLVLKDSNGDLNSSYERVGMLENKIKLDKYNATYLTSLLAEYDNHIDILEELYLASTDKTIKNILKEELDKYILKQKDVADSLVEYEYYNKYSLDKIARCYFKRYVSYAKLNSMNFKNDEIAYTFYIGYGIKLTDRIENIGSKNATAIRFAYDIYNEYLPAIKKENTMIGSNMLKSAIEDITYKLNVLKTKINK